MLNLRQFNKSEVSQACSDALHFSRFSMSFRAPPSSLGNIGEPLDHGQSERLHEDEDHTEEANMGELEFDTTDLENAKPVSSLPGTRWDNESIANAYRQSQPPAADPSRTPEDEENGASHGGSDSTARISETHVSAILDEQVRSASQ